MSGADRRTVRVFIGYDPRDAVAFDVLAHSIQARTRSPVSIAPLKLSELGDDALIGQLPHRWNHLVDYDPPLPAEELSNLHFTNGGPYFDDFKNCGYADLWFVERDRMLCAG